MEINRSGSCHSKTARKSIEKVLDCTPPTNRPSRYRDPASHPLRRRLAPQGRTFANRPRYRSRHQCGHSCRTPGFSANSIVSRSPPWSASPPSTVTAAKLKVSAPSSVDARSVRSALYLAAFNLVHNVNIKNPASAYFADRLKNQRQGNQSCPHSLHSQAPRLHQHNVENQFSVEFKIHPCFPLTESTAAPGSNVNARRRYRGYRFAQPPANGGDPSWGQNRRVARLCDASWGRSRVRLKGGNMRAQGDVLGTPRRLTECPERAQQFSDRIRIDSVQSS